MKEFSDLNKFSKHLEKLCLSYDRYETKAAEVLGEILEHEAKDKIGHLQEGSGPFKAWEELKESTKTDKEEQGYVFNADYNPLYRTGKSRDSIHSSYVKNIRTLFLGSTDDRMVWLEGGTRYMAPRSTIGLTMYQAYPVVNYVMGNMLKKWASGERLLLSQVRRGTYGSV